MLTNIKNTFLFSLYRFCSNHCELGIWCSALMYLMLIDPAMNQPLSLCPLYNLGFHFCPGCGLGHAISFFLHGNIGESFHTHILGIPATIVLFHRIVVLSKNVFRFTTSA